MPVQEAVTLGQLFNELIQRHGFGVAFGVAMAVFGGSLFVIILRWLLKQQEKINAQALEREVRLSGIINAQVKALADHNQTTIDFRNEVKSAMQYQREEHAQMLHGFEQMNSRLERVLERG